MTTADQHTASAHRPRVAIAGIAIESSTFTPYRSSFGDFEVRRGEEILDRYPFFRDGSESGRALREAADYVGTLHARALPGGPLRPHAYQAWKHEILGRLADALAEGPLDALYFDIHGAMSVEGMDDAEGDLITAIREVIGPDVLVGAAMDLHGNVSDTLFAHCDLMTCYRHAPHIDAWETRERGLRDLVAAASHPEGPRKPAKALVHVPILLPGEKTSTRVEPAQSLYAQIPELTSRDGITDVSYWVGFAWADQPRCKAAIVAFGEDQKAVDEAALELATAVWQARHDFVFVAPTGSFEDCLQTAISSSARPFWISDSGDNPGAGGADDITYCTHHLLARHEITSGQVSALMVSLVDPVSTDAAFAAGADGVVDLVVGGRIDDRWPGPLPLRARVVSLGEASLVGGRAAALRVLRPVGAEGAGGAGGGASAGQTGDDAEVPSVVDTGLTIVVTERRSQWCTRDMFDAMGLAMDGFDIVTVKMGYLEPDQYEAAADWLLALTPGGVDQDLLRLGHVAIERPMIPFDEEIPAPTEADIKR